jgi:hypothetical protein
MRIRYVLLVLGTALATAACAAPTTPSQVRSGDPTEGSSQVAASPGTGTLRQAPADLGCDAMPVDYRKVTFHVDPGAADPVTAATDTGATLKTYWSPGFTLTSVQDAASAPVVQDPNGQVVAHEGEELAIPEATLPRLHGYFVCPSTDAVYVLLQDPT